MGAYYVSFPTMQAQPLWTEAILMSAVWQGLNPTPQSDTTLGCPHKGKGVQMCTV